MNARENMLKKLIDKYRTMTVVSKATIWFMICSFIQKGLSFITTPIFTRLLTEEQFGLYNVYLSWLQILVIFTTLRLDYGVFNKGMSKYVEDRDGYTSSMLSFTTILTIFLFLIYLIFQKQVNRFTEMGTLLMVAMFMEVVVGAAVNFWSLRERYEFHYKTVVFYTLLVAVSSSVVGIVAVLVCQEKGIARILSNALVHLICGGVIYCIVFKRSKFNIKREYVKFALLFNIPVIPHYFSAYIIEQSDKIMIQKLIDLNAAALYSIAYTVGGIVKIVTAAISNTLIPLQYRQLEKKEFQQLNKNIFVLMFGVTCLLIMVALAGPEVVFILGGEKYLPAINVIPPVAASVFYSFLYNVVANIEFYYDENKFAMKISLVGAGINFLLNLLFVPKFGYVAAAYTTMISYMFFAVGHLLFVNYVFKKKEQSGKIETKKLLIMGALSTVVCIGCNLLYKNVWIRIGVFVVLCTVAVCTRRALLEMLKKSDE